MGEIKIHPAAECVRLMDTEELASLAASIEAHGLRDPIIMGRVNGAETELLVDGRNRLNACEIAKVEPRFEVMQFDDDEAVKAFVEDRSEHRNISKGQKAMRIALLYPTEKGGRGKKSKGKTAAENAGVSDRRIEQARSVYAYSPELALSVRDGPKKLDEALAEVREARKALNSSEAMLARLRAEAPDLADLVTEERLQVKDAIVALDSRIAEAKRAQETATRVLQSIFNALFPRGAAPDEWAERLTKDVSPEFWSGADELSVKNLAACADVMRAISERFTHG
jgi:hypothetical protein